MADLLSSNEEQPLQPEEAQKILLQFGKEDELWVLHSQRVAENAYYITKALLKKGVQVNPNLIYAGALLHDIGRSVSHTDHGIEGYKILSNLGRPEIGRFCLTHWLKGRPLSSLDGVMPREKWDWLPQDLALEQLTLEDKIVIISDAMAEGVQLVTIEERLEGWRNRYGETKWLEENGRILYSIKQELEDLLGRSLNSLLFHPTHLDDSGAAKMVDIGWKSKTERIARATGFIKMKSATLRIALEKSGKKGDVFQVARVAAILAAKKTFEIIPLCHQIPLSSIQVDFLAESKGIRINSFVKTTYSTGVEMEAITAVSVAALTIYDMLKGIDKTMEIGEIHLEEKQGGKSGAFFWPGFSAR